MDNTKIKRLILIGLGYCFLCITSGTYALDEGASQDPASPLESHTRSAEHNVVSKLSNLIRSYTEISGKPPESWDELEREFGEWVWESKDQWNNIKRRFSFVLTEGVISTKIEGSLEGTMLLAPIHSIRENRSKEEGRFTIWQLNSGAIFPRWNTESELRTFSNWDVVAAKLAAAKAALPQLPSKVAKPTRIFPRSTAPLTDTSPSTGSSSEEPPAGDAGRSTQLWVWLAGIASLIAAILVLLRRRS